MNNINQEDFEDFVSYCASFYGVGGLYVEDFNKAPSAEAIEAACRIVSESDTFEGDSVDREAVRALLEEQDTETAPDGVFVVGGFVEAIDGYDGFNFGRTWVVSERNGREVVLVPVSSWAETSMGISRRRFETSAGTAYIVEGTPGAEFISETAEGFGVWA